MKPRQPHPDKTLTAARVRALKEPGRYADGNGLYLQVDPSGAKRWYLRTVIHGRRRDIGLGGLKLVSLAEAREAAARYRKIARTGGDPLKEKRQAQRTVPTFAKAAEAVHEEHKAAWKNRKHIDQWINTLNTYAVPEIGAKRVDLIDTPDILRVLSPIWLTKAETARRVKQRLAAVMDWAIAAGHRTAANPVAGVTKGLPKQPDRKQHFAAMPYASISDFMDTLRTSVQNEVTRLAFEFLILTAARTNEVVNARWAEIDLAKKVWTIPAERMKAAREHRVPLSKRCQEILKRARTLAGGSDFVFPGRSPEKPLSNMVFLMALRRMEIDATVHGFRSAFSDWAAERTNFPREVCEMALAHTIRNKAEAAYRRGDLLEKRRKLMETWANFVTSGSAEVVTLHAG